MREIVQDLLILNIILGMFDGEEKNKSLGIMRLLLAVGSLILAIKGLYEVCTKKGIE